MSGPRTVLNLMTCVVLVAAISASGSPVAKDVAPLCCGLPASELVECVGKEVSSAGPIGGTNLGSSNRILVVMSVSPHVQQYGSYAAAVNAAWARHFGHHFVMQVAKQETATRRFHSIIQATFQALRAATADVGWVLRLDCDAVLANFESDALSQLVTSYPQAHVLLSRADQVVTRAISRSHSFNFGVVLFKKSEFSVRLLQQLTASLDDSMVDQDVFGLLHQADWSGLQSMTVGLPEIAINSGNVAITEPPTSQPIYHLWSHSDSVRTAVFREAHVQVCQGRRLLDLNSTYVNAFLAVAQGSSDDEVAGLSGQTQLHGREFHSWRFAAVLEHWGSTVAAEASLRSGLEAAKSWSDYSVWDASEALVARIHLVRLLVTQGRVQESFVAANEAMHACDQYSQKAGVQFDMLRDKCASAQINVGKWFAANGVRPDATLHLGEGWRKLQTAKGDFALDTARAAAASLSIQEVATIRSVALMRAAVRTAEEHLPLEDSERMLFHARLGLLLRAAGEASEARRELVMVLRGLASRPLPRFNDWELLDRDALFKSVVVAAEHMVYLSEGTTCVCRPANPEGSFVRIHEWDEEAAEQIVQQLTTYVDAAGVELWLCLARCQSAANTDELSLYAEPPKILGSSPSR